MPRLLTGWCRPALKRGERHRGLVGRPCCCGLLVCSDAVYDDLVYSGVVHRSRAHASHLAQLSRRPGLTRACLHRSVEQLGIKGTSAVPEETPRSVLFRNRAKAFQNLASDLQTTRPGYRELAAAYEQLANETERGEAIHSVAQRAPKPD